MHTNQHHMNTNNGQQGNTQQSPQMCDRDRLTDILTEEKFLTDGFNTAVREASHPALHQEMMAILNETHQCQYQIYEFMYQQGMYPLEAADASKLAETYQKFNGYTAQFPYPSMPQ